MYLVELSDSVTYPVNGDSFPVLTHVRLVNLTWEVGRPTEGKPSCINVWLATGYLKDGTFYEAPGYSGQNIVFDNDVSGLVDAAPTLGESLSAETCRSLLQLCVQLGHVVGTVVTV